MYKPSEIFLLQKQSSPLSNCSGNYAVSWVTTANFSHNYDNNYILLRLNKMMVVPQPLWHVTLFREHVKLSYVKRTKKTLRCDIRSFFWLASNEA